jgi:hypothetical protein
MDDLQSHPPVGTPLDYTDPDALSFHEVVCDLARQVGKSRVRYAALMPEVLDLLEGINSNVMLIAELVERRRP